MEIHFGKVEHSIHTCCFRGPSFHDNCQKVMTHPVISEVIDRVRRFCTKNCSFRGKVDEANPMIGTLKWKL